MICGNDMWLTHFPSNSTALLYVVYKYFKLNLGELNNQIQQYK